MSSGRESELIARSQVQAVLPTHVGWGLVASPVWDRDAATAAERRAARQAEFRCGRHCAVQALQQVGWSPKAVSSSTTTAGNPDGTTNTEVVGVGPDRRPLWPIGFIGSLSHSRHWTWAVAARQAHYRGIGIDTEAIIAPKTATELRSEIGRAEEWERLAKTGLAPRLFTTLLWSAKEAYFKLWFPLHERFLTWQEVSLCDAAVGPVDRQPPAETQTVGRIQLTLGTTAAVREEAGALPELMERTDVIAFWTAQDVFALAVEPSASGPRFHERGDGVV